MTRVSGRIGDLVDGRVPGRDDSGPAENGTTVGGAVAHPAPDGTATAGAEQPDGGEQAPRGAAPRVPPEPNGKPPGAGRGRARGGRNRRRARTGSDAAGRGRDTGPTGPERGRSDGGPTAAPSAPPAAPRRDTAPSGDTGPEPADLGTPSPADAATGTPPASDGPHGGSGTAAAVARPGPATDGVDPPAPTGPTAPPARVLFLAVAASRARSLKNHAGYLVARGVQVDLVTVNPDVWRDIGLHPAVRVHGLRDGEGHHPLPRGERILVFRAPGKAIDLLRPLARHPRFGRGVELGVGVAERAHRRAADAFHRKVFIRGYRVVRPYLLWRVARRAVVPGLDLDAFDRAVVWDSHAVPLAWHLGRMRPDLDVTFDFDRADWERLPVVEPSACPELAAERRAEP